MDEDDEHEARLIAAVDALADVVDPSYAVHVRGLTWTTLKDGDVGDLALVAQPISSLAIGRNPLKPSPYGFQGLTRLQGEISGAVERARTV